MDRKALVYSGLLLVSLVIVSFLLSRGAIRALTDPADLSLTTPAADTATGDTREFEATLLFPDFEEAWSAAWS